MVQRSTPPPSAEESRERTAPPLGPVRMCVGCRQRVGIADLVRVVADTASDRPRILVDFARTEPGRGAWLHPREDCTSAAIRRRAFGSALRVSGLAVTPEDFTALLGEVTNDDGSHRELEQVAEDMSTP